MLSIGYVLSLIILVIENLFHPKSHNGSAKESINESLISRKIEAFVKELHEFTDDNTIKMYLRDEVMPKLLQKKVEQINESKTENTF